MRERTRLSVIKAPTHKSRIHVHDCKAMLNTLFTVEGMRLIESLSSTPEMAPTLVSICCAAVIKGDNQFSDEVRKGNKIAKTNAERHYHCGCKEGA